MTDNVLGADAQWDIIGASGSSVSCGRNQREFASLKTAVVICACMVVPLRVGRPAADVGPHEPNATYNFRNNAVPHVSAISITRSGLSARNSLVARRTASFELV